ncbi:MAG: hypothetical protein ACRC9T_09005 [Vibrionaceae bacterium]
MPKLLLVASTVSLLSFAAAAEDAPNTLNSSNFSYDYFEARIGASPVTYGLGGSFSVHPNAHIRMRADSRFESDFDANLLFGFHTPINDWADIYGEFGMRAISNIDDYLDGENKFAVEVLLGVRQWLGPQFELGAEVGHINFRHKNTVVGGVSGRFHATELFSLGLQGRINDVYGDNVMFSTRFKF